MSFLIRLVTAFGITPFMAFADPAGAQTPYTQMEFKADCQRAGGAAWLEPSQAICVLQNQKDILCVIDAGGVFDCALDPGSRAANSSKSH